MRVRSRQSSSSWRQHHYYCKSTWLLLLLAVGGTVAVVLWPFWFLTRDSVHELQGLMTTTTTTKQKTSDDTTTTHPSGRGVNDDKFSEQQQGVAREITHLLGCTNITNTRYYPLHQTAIGLFCNAAWKTSNNPNNDLQLPAPQPRHQLCGASDQRLLSLWHRMRQTVADDYLLVQSLRAAVRPAHASYRKIGKHHNLKLWIPQKDSGSVLQVLKELSQGDYGDYFPLLQADGNETKLFCDVGSNLGFVTLLTALDTNATIVALEAASPTWILQQLNLECNLPDTRLATVHALWAALGDGGGKLKLTWRPQSTITVRGWDEHWTTGRNKRLAKQKQKAVPQSLQFTVPVRTLRSVLAETVGRTATAATTPISIDVLKMDCEGCEYNVIPDLQPDEFAAIHTLIGEIHYGFIPLPRAPSTQRAQLTHQRLCSHVNFVQFAKECCQFPNQTVKQQYPNETIMRIRDMPTYQTLCHDFDQWAQKNKLLHERNDTAWRNVGKEW